MYVYWWLWPASSNLTGMLSNIGHIASHLVTPEEVEEVFTRDEVEVDYDVIGGERRWTVAGRLLPQPNDDSSVRQNRRILR